MEKLKLDFENCYGIKKLVQEFSFKDDNIIVIYAPNGTMKTSFADTFKELSIGSQPCDRVYARHTFS